MKICAQLDVTAIASRLRSWPPCGSALDESTGMQLNCETHYNLSYADPDNPY